MRQPEQTETEAILYQKGWLSWVQWRQPWGQVLSLAPEDWLMNQSWSQPTVSKRHRVFASLTDWV